MVSIRVKSRGRFLLAAACGLLLAATAVRGQAATGQRVEVDELKAAIDAGATMLLIDVREDWEVASGSMPGSIHIPVAELERRMPDIPRDVRLVFF
jgi:predicted sulfurtransferase